MSFHWLRATDRGRHLRRVIRRRIADLMTVPKSPADQSRARKDASGGMAAAWGGHDDGCERSRTRPHKPRIRSPP